MAPVHVHYIGHQYQWSLYEHKLQDYITIASLFLCFVHQIARLLPTIGIRASGSLILTATIHQTKNIPYVTVELITDLSQLYHRLISSRCNHQICNIQLEVSATVDQNQPPESRTGHSWPPSQSPDFENIIESIYWLLLRCKCSRIIAWIIPLQVDWNQGRSEFDSSFPVDRKS